MASARSALELLGRAECLVCFVSKLVFLLIVCDSRGYQAAAIHAHRNRMQLNDHLFFCPLMFKMTDYRHYLELMGQISLALEEIWCSSIDFKVSPDGNLG